MAFDEKNIAQRTMARLRRFMGITSSAEIPDNTSPDTKKVGDTVYYGMFSADELRHLDGVYRNYQTRGSQGLTEDAISAQLTEIAANTRKKIDEIKNLKMLAPEIDQAKAIIVSSIISPTELQTDCLTVRVDAEGLTPELNAKLTHLLTDYFNDVYHLAPKLSEWLGCAGFEEGAKPILVLPRHQLDVLNTVADKWDPDTLKEFKQCRAEALQSTEGLTVGVDSTSMISSLENLVTAQLQSASIGSDFMSNEELDAFSKENNIKKADGPLPAASLAKCLVDKSFKLLRTSEAGDCVLVTRDLTDLGKLERNTDKVVRELEKQAEQQVSGYNADADGQLAPELPVFTVSDIVANDEHDLPIVIEFPSDSVIPICAPRDNKNHIGYYVLIDDNGQPIKGEYAFNYGIDNDVNQRLATNAAKSVYGNQAFNTYLSAGMTDEQAIDKMTKIFSVAVNRLLESRLQKDGLYGLDINVHEAVGKALFFNLLAKNRIKMVFVPANMMVYYRFMHRDDGTGKTFLEDIAYILALRCTLTVAKLMAAIENATKHRRVEVQIDEKNQNPIQTLELVRHSWLNKKTPQFTTDPTTAAENIINQHLSIVPKGLVGNTDDLNITTEQSYGQGQAPDNDLMDQLNNWVGMGLKIPPSALNQLNETEYAKSVATSNLFFSNAVRNWQNIIRPFNKKFVTNYVMCNSTLIKQIYDIIEAEHAGVQTVTRTQSDGKLRADDPSEHRSIDPNNDSDHDVNTVVKRVIASIEVILPPPNVAANKAKYEEVTSQCDAIDKILEKIYPDDIAVNDDIKNMMTGVRAIVTSKCIREFLPTVGFHSIAEVPSLEELDSDLTVKAVQFLDNLKRRADNMHRMFTDQLATSDTSAISDTGSDTGGESGGGEPSMPGEGGPNNNDDLSQFKI